MSHRSQAKGDLAHRHGASRPGVTTSNPTTRLPPGRARLAIRPVLPSTVTSPSMMSSSVESVSAARDLSALLGPVVAAARIDADVVAMDVHLRAVSHRS